MKRKQQHNNSEVTSLYRVDAVTSDFDTAIKVGQFAIQDTAIYIGTSTVPYSIMYYVVGVCFCLLSFFVCPCIAINVNVQYNGGFLPDITVYC